MNDARPVYLSTPAPLYHGPCYHNHSIHASSLDDTHSWLSTLGEGVSRQPQLLTSTALPCSTSLVRLRTAPLHHVLSFMHALPAYPSPAALHATLTRPPTHALSLSVLKPDLSRVLLAPLLRITLLTYVFKKKKNATRAQIRTSSGT